MSSKILVLHHFGLGDIINLSPFIYQLLSQMNTVYLLISAKYEENVATLYKNYILKSLF